MKKLVYTGSGAFLPGVPAADHECDSDDQAEELVESGLYKYAGKSAAGSSTPKEGK